MIAWASAAMARGVLLSDRHVPGRRAPLWCSRELVFSIWFRWPWGALPQVRI